MLSGCCGDEGSGRVVQFPHDVLVQAEVLLGGFRREPAVKVLTEAEVELAGVGLGGQWFGYAFAGVIQHFDKPTDGTHHSVIEQGVEMGRPSQINLTVEVAAGKVKAARIGGNAVVIAEGMLKV